MPVRELRFDATLLERRPEDGWEERNGAWWMVAEALDPRAMTSFMLANQARLATIMAMGLEGGGIRLDYYWDVKGVVYAITAQTSGDTLVSIADLCPAADWLEREIHEYFNVQFSGRVDTKPLMLRPGLEPGLNRRQDGKL
jgi:hypothetical protein